MHPTLETCSFFDNIFKKFFKICKKYSKDVPKDQEDKMWFLVVDCLLEMKKNEEVIGKNFCKDFFNERLKIVLEQLIRFVPFKMFLLHLCDKNKDIFFRDLYGIIQQVFFKHTSESIVLLNANNSIFKVNTELFHQFQLSSKRGLLFRQRVCGVCKRYMDCHVDEESANEQITHMFENEEHDDDDDEAPYFYDSSKETIKIFACRHTFHIRCIHKYYI
jgi:hypothetical protein